MVPACLPAPGQTFSTGLMSGWGRLGDSQSWSRTLRAASVSIVTTGDCNENVKYFPEKYFNISPQYFQLFPRPGLVSVGPGQVCAGDLDHLKGACHGDSGGPLVGQDSQARWAAVGLVSWRLAATGCDGPSYTVFTRISHYLPWIADQMGLLPPLY